MIRARECVGLSAWAKIISAMMVVALAKSPLSDLYTVAVTPPHNCARELEDGESRGKWGGEPKKERLVEKDEKDDADERKKLTEGKTGCVETMGGD